MKKAFTLIEIVTVFCLILLVVSLSIPLILNDSKQAKVISSWRHTYSDYMYLFKTIQFQNNETETLAIDKNLKKAKTQKVKENVLIETFRPYLRITQKFEDKRYNIKYMNSEKIQNNQYYYFENFYKTQNDTIVGIKWIGELYDDTPFVMLLVDINGEKSPNVWGKDIFGMNIYRHKIEPFGKGIPTSEVEYDCSKHGRGIYCSYDYLTGVQF